jgi:molybdopterin molybdotransferase
MLELEAALKRILSTIQPLDHEIVALADTAGRIAAEPVMSPVDLPAFDNSAMDGYAVRAADLTNACADRPVALRLTGKIAAGEVQSGKVDDGACARLFTGSPLPAGADAVVMQEDTRADGEHPDRIWFPCAVKPWENIRLQGEDVKRGVKLVETGARISAGHVALLAAAGVRDVKVSRQPRVAVLATGSELFENDGPLPPGKIYESNRVMLATLMKRAGAVPEIFPLVPDTPKATRSALEKALTECDAVITSGGVSVGEYDFVKTAFEELGGKIAFWKVAIRPGKPFVFGCAGTKLLFGLPGNPVSALVTFLLLTRPALARMQGAAELELPKLPGRLVQPLANPGDRRHFMRVAVDESGRVHPAGTQASHILSSLAGANGLVDVPPATVVPAGASVSVLRWEW